MYNLAAARDGTKRCAAREQQVRCPVHLTAIPLRSKAAGELVRYHPTASG
jgi:hypothetical protein